MDLYFTQEIEALEEYSLALIALFEKLPNHFFEDEKAMPSNRVVENIIRFSKRKKQSLNRDGQICGYHLN